MIKLYQFPPMWGLPNPSPFCLKLETYLRMAGLPYEAPRKANLRNAPKGKMPYIEDQGKVIADSGLIIEYLKKTYGDKLDAHLNPLEKSQAVAFTRLMEEDLYWCAVHSRWIDDHNWEIVKQAFFSFLPPPLRQIVPPLIRSKVRKSLYAQGMGRHSPEEISQIGIRDLTALSNFLGDKPFFMGSQPTTLDAVAYGFLPNLLWTPFESPMKEYAQTKPNLVAYCERMKQRYYS